MSFSTRPYRFFEISDQLWFPPLLRACVQAGLTKLWVTKLVFASAAPANLAAELLASRIEDVEDLVVVDFGSGGGGPIPQIAHIVNASRKENGLSVVPFLMTDLAPHIEAWKTAVKEYPDSGLGYLNQSVDAANPPESLISQDGRNIFRVFCLAFHHFDDELAKKIMHSTLETANGFV
jgi:hypothetical protein